MIASLLSAAGDSDWEDDRFQNSGSQTAVVLTMLVASVNPGQSQLCILIFSIFEIFIMRLFLTFVILVSLLAPSSASADISSYYWNFGTTSANANPSLTGSGAGINVGSLAIGNSLGSVTTPISSTSASSGYTGASGQFNIGNAFRIGALNTASGGSGYFEFTVSTDALTSATLNDFDFGSRSTGTGPQAFALRSSLDGYASNIFSVAVANNSAWAFRNNTFTQVAFGPSTSVTFRLFGFNGTGSPASGTINGRIDDLTATFNLTSVPEPSALTLGVFTAVAGLAFRRRKSD